jgi:hypothetical protein
MDPTVNSFPIHPLAGRELSRDSQVGSYRLARNSIFPELDERRTILLLHFVFWL